MLALLSLIFVLGPSYVWRFKLAGLPVNFLELILAAFFLTFLVWILSVGEWERFRRYVKSLGWATHIPIGLFLLAGIISTIISPDRQRAEGLLVVYFIQPLIVYYLAAYILNSEQKKLFFTRLIFVICALLSAYAIIQYFTLIGLPPAWWGNTVEPKRSLSIFEYPNAYALWLDNLMAFTLPFVFSKKFGPLWLRVLFIFSVGGLLMSFSRGGWLAFFFATVVFVLFFVSQQFTGASAKKIKLIILAGFIIVCAIIAATPNLRYRVLLPFLGDKSTLTRASLWQDAALMLHDSPILGKGLYGFHTDYAKYNVDLTIPQPYDYPHNIFLNFWVETGLLGLISFIWITIRFIGQTLDNRQSLYSVGLILFFVAIYIHGMDDVPYFLNVLALTFWLVLALGTPTRNIDDPPVK